MTQARCRNDGADAVRACLDLTAFVEPVGKTLSEKVESEMFGFFFFFDCAAVVFTFVLQK